MYMSAIVEFYFLKLLVYSLLRGEKVNSCIRFVSTDACDKPLPIRILLAISHITSKTRASRGFDPRSEWYGSIAAAQRTNIVWSYNQTYLHHHTMKQSFAIPISIDDVDIF